MISPLPENQTYYTPIKQTKLNKVEEREINEIHKINRTSDCISLTKNSGNKSNFLVQSFNDCRTLTKGKNFQDQMQCEISEKTKGIKNILGKLGQSIDNIKGEVDSLVNSQNSKVRNYKYLYQDNDLSQKENYPSTQVQQQSLQLSSKLQNRSCTKSCSKIQQQLKKYQNNQDFQQYKNMLKDITFSNSNQKASKENIIKQEDDTIIARRKLDFDISLEEDFENYLCLQTPKKSKTNPKLSQKEEDTIIQEEEYTYTQEGYTYTQEEEYTYIQGEEDTITQQNKEEEDEDNDQFQEPLGKKIFLKNIERGKDFVNYFYIYRTHN